RHEPAAEYPIELPDARGQTLERGRADLGQRTRSSVPHSARGLSSPPAASGAPLARAHPRPLGLRWFLDQRVPGSASGALSVPLARPKAALRAAEDDVARHPRDSVRAAGDAP